MSSNHYPSYTKAREALLAIASKNGRNIRVQAGVIILKAEMNGTTTNITSDRADAIARARAYKTCGKPHHFEIHPQVLAQFA